VKFIELRLKLKDFKFKKFELIIEQKILKKLKKRIFKYPQVLSANNMRTKFADFRKVKNKKNTNHSFNIENA